MQGPGRLTFTAHRDTWCAAMESDAKVVRVAIVGSAPALTSLTFRGSAFGLDEDAEIRGSRCPSTVQDSPEPSFRRCPSTVSTNSGCSWVRGGEFVLGELAAGLRGEANGSDGWRGRRVNA